MGTIPFKKEETGSGGEEVKKDEGGVELKMDEGFDPEKILKRARADPEIYRYKK